MTRIIHAGFCGVWDYSDETNGSYTYVGTIHRLWVPGCPELTNPESPSLDWGFFMFPTIAGV